MRGNLHTPKTHRSRTPCCSIVFLRKIDRMHHMVYNHPLNICLPLPYPGTCSRYLICALPSIRLQYKRSKRLNINNEVKWRNDFQRYDMFKTCWLRTWFQNNEKSSQDFLLTVELNPKHIVALLHRFSGTTANKSWHVYIPIEPFNFSTTIVFYWRVAFV